MREPLTTTSAARVAAATLALAAAFLAAGLYGVPGLADGAAVLVALVLAGLGFWASGPQSGRPGDEIRRDAAQPALNTTTSAALLAAACALALAYTIWDQLSWPDRSVFIAFLQIPLLAGLLFQAQRLLAQRWLGPRPRPMWPMRVAAATLSVPLGVGLLTWQHRAAQALFEQRQQPLIEALASATDPCGAHAAYLARYPRPSRQIPRLWAGQGRFVLGYQASTDLEKLLIAYDSAAREWTTTFRDNRAGLGRFEAATVGLTSCRPGQAAAQ